jgi:hypothetical protein
MAFDVRWKMGGVGVVVGVLSGCSGPASGPMADPAGAPQALSPEASKALEAAIEQDLAALRALDVVEVGRLVMRLPEEAMRCYGLPCTDEDKPLFDAERQEQAERLHAFVADAIPAVKSADLAAAPSDAEVDASLASLRALEIVTVGALIVTHPENKKECYNLACPADVEAANAENAARRSRVVALATATEQ